MDDIVLFNECSIDDIKTIGKKAAFISELHSKGFNVPAGFIMTGNLFVKFIEMVKLKDTIAEILMSGMEKERKSTQIQQTILNIPFPEDLANFIYQNYLKLGNNNEPFVALKVSSTSDYVDDMVFLNIQGKERLVNGIKSCWASVFSAENIDLKRFKPSIVIHNMVNPIKSGYVYSRNPINGNPNEVLIQVCSGLGTSISLGQTLPSAYIVRKEDLSVVKSFMKEQHIQYSLNMERKRTEKIELQEPVKNILDDFIIKELVKLAIRVESRIDDPQRISFAIDKNIAVVSSKSISTKKFKEQFGDSYREEQVSQETTNNQNTYQQGTPEQEFYNKNLPNNETPNQNHYQKPNQDDYQNNFQRSDNNQSPERIDENQNEQSNSFMDIRNFIDESNEDSEEHNNENTPQISSQDEDDMLQYYEPNVHHETKDSNQSREMQNHNEDFQAVKTENQIPNSENIQRNEEFHDTENYNLQQRSNSQEQMKTEQPYVEQQHAEKVYEQNNLSQTHQTQQKGQFENKFAPENPTTLLGKISFISGFSIVSCDMAIGSALRKKYRELFFKEPPINIETMINDLKNRISVPYEEEIRRVRKIRDNFLNSGREPEPREIHYSLDYTKKFVDEF